MRLIPALTAMVILGFLAPHAVFAEDILIEDFTNEPETRWRFIADTVMGGVSAGQVEFIREDGEAHARMTGSVSTENNGGFIQFRMELPTPLPKGTVGLRLVIRGNDQRYFLHLRTSGTILPWQYYQAGFEVDQEWAEVRLPLEEFEPSGLFLRSVPKPESVKSVGIVAFGRDHEAEIDVREVGYY